MVGRAASVAKAQKTYRDKPAVRERHCQQERARRARLAERVRDHIQRPASSRVTVESMVAPKALVAATAAPPDARITAWPRLAQWRLIVGHALAADAEALRRRGTVVRCACCGRAGRVVAVVVRAELEWRRQRDEDGA